MGKDQGVLGFINLFIIFSGLGSENVIAFL
jgi:hypothetical protein